MCTVCVWYRFTFTIKQRNGERERQRCQVWEWRLIGVWVAAAQYVCVSECLFAREAIVYKRLAFESNRENFLAFYREAIHVRDFYTYERKRDGELCLVSALELFTSASPLFERERTLYKSCIREEREREGETEWPKRRRRVEAAKLVFVFCSPQYTTALVAMAVAMLVACNYRPRCNPLLRNTSYFTRSLATNEHFALGSPAKKRE